MGLQAMLARQDKGEHDDSRRERWHFGVAVSQSTSGSG
jgi:hypothetical protein